MIGKIDETLEKLLKIGTLSLKENVEQPGDQWLYLDTETDSMNREEMAFYLMSVTEHKVDFEVTTDGTFHIYFQIRTGPEE